jgi:CDP-glycerol glycerophosphotransferase (TagB/SpsB family)
MKLKSIFKYFLRGLYYIPFYFIYFFSFLTLRRKKKVTFIEGRRGKFSDNSKYLFLYMSSQDINIECTWITKSITIMKSLKKEGYNAEYCFSLKGIYTLLTSRSIIIDSRIPDILFWFTGRASRINLWHGIGVKKIENDIKNGHIDFLYHARGLKNLIINILMPGIYFNKNLDCVISTSLVFQNIFSSAFNIEKEKVPITGYPRNDIFFKKIKGSHIGVDNYLHNYILLNKKKGKKIILYAPTFRDTDTDTFIKNIFFLLLKIDVFSKRNNIIFIFKPHENLTNLFEKKLAKNINLDNIFFVKSNTDIYPDLCLFDLLITDYSSIFTDFLLLDKPIIFFPYDIEKYKNKDRSFYFDYNKFTPGPKAYDFDQLLIYIEKSISEYDYYKPRRKKIKDLCFYYQDGYSSQRTCNAIFNKYL